MLSVREKLCAAVLLLALIMAIVGYHSISAANKEIKDLSAVTTEACMPVNEGSNTNLCRYRDSETGVTCYVITGIYKGGIFCIPDKELKK